MKYRMFLLSVLFLGLSFLMQIKGGSKTRIGQNDCHVAIHITNFNDDIGIRIRAEISKQKDITMEYSCTESGFVFIKINSSHLQSSGDFQMKIKQILSNAGVLKFSILKTVVLPSSFETKC